MLKTQTLKNPDAKTHLPGASMSAARRAVLCVLLIGGLVVTTPSSVLGTQSVTLAWNPVINANVAGYKVYYGSASGNYTNVTSVGNVTNATISGLAEGATYYFATTTLSTSGLESGYSSEISYTVPKLPSPMVITEKISASVANPITLQYCTNMSSPRWWTVCTFSVSTNCSFTNMPAVLIRGVCSNLTSSITLTWPPSTSPGVTGYRIYYGVASGVYLFALNVGKVTVATIPNLVPGVRYYLLVDTYNSLGTVSPYLNETSATSPATSFSLTIGH